MGPSFASSGFSPAAFSSSAFWIDVAVGGWRGHGGVWEWLLEVKRKSKASEPKKRKVERIVADAVAEAVAEHLDDGLAAIEKATERAIADTKQGVRIAKRELFERYVRAEVEWQQNEQRARELRSSIARTEHELAVQMEMEQAAARRLRRKRRVALFLSVQD